jgi:hypothetical protein
MNASAITMFVVAAMLLGAHFVHAEGDQLESYYNDYLTKKLLIVNGLHLLVQANAHPKSVL